MILSFYFDVTFVLLLRASRAFSVFADTEDTRKKREGRGGNVCHSVTRCNVDTPREKKLH